MKKLIILLSVVLLTAGVSFWWFYRDSEVRKLTTYYEQGTSFLDAGQLNEAGAWVRKAQGVQKGHPLTCILSARLAWEAQDDRSAALEWTRRIGDLRGFSAQQYYWKFRLNFNLEDFDSARESLATFQFEFPAHPLYHKAAGLMALQDKEIPTAYFFLDRAHEQGLMDLEYKIILARMLRDNDFFENRMRAKILYRELAEDPGIAGFSALIELLGSKNLQKSPNERIYYFQRIASHPFFMNPQNSFLETPEVARILRDNLIFLNPEAALHVAEKLIAGKGAALEDELAAARLFLVQKKPRQVAGLVQKLQREHPQNPEVAILQLHLQFADNRVEEAMTSLRDPQGYSLDHPALAPVIRTGLDLHDENMANSEKEFLYRILLRHARLSPQETLVFWTRLIQLNPLKEKEIMEEALAGWKFEPGMLAGWLLRNGYFTEILSRYGQADLEKDTSLFGPVFLALLRTGQRERALDLLETHQSILQEEQVYLSRVIYGLEVQDAALFSTAWEDAFAFGLSSFNSPLLLNLGQIAREQKDEEKAFRAYRQCFLYNYLPTPEDWAYAFGFAYSRESLGIIIEMARRAALRYPSNPVFINNLAYLNLVEQQEIDGAVEKLKPLVAQYPDELNFRMTLGLGYLRQGEPNEAYKLIEGLDVDWNQVGPSSRLILAIILAANGQTAFANNFLINMNFNALLSQERDLIKTYFPSYVLPAQS